MGRTEWHYIYLYFRESCQNTTTRELLKIIQSSSLEIEVDVNCFRLKTEISIFELCANLPTVHKLHIWTSTAYLSNSSVFSKIGSYLRVASNGCPELHLVLFHSNRKHSTLNSMWYFLFQSLDSWYNELYLMNWFDGIIIIAQVSVVVKNVEKMQDNKN